MQTDIPIEKVRDCLRDCVQAGGMMNLPHQRAVKFVVSTIERELRIYQAAPVPPNPTTKD